MAPKTARAPVEKNPSRISVGIGSWTDPEYNGVLFPPGVKSDERLKVYATRFNHVEVNSSYHRTPPAAWVENWVAQTPPGFVFDLKLHRRFSASPGKAAADDKLVSQVLRAAAPLIDAKKLGAFFLVMPPTFAPKKRQLDEFDALIAKLEPHLVAIELRHSGWVEDDAREQTLAYFRSRKLVWIAVDMPRIQGATIMPAVDEVTNSRLAYLRLHGRNEDWLTAKSAEERHTYPYPPKVIHEIAGRVRSLAEKAEVVHVVANNHALDFAPKTALALQEVLGVGPASAEPRGSADDKG